MYDFGNEENQKVGGAIPAGSSVKVRLTIRQPDLKYRHGDFVLRSQKGLLGLDAEYEVLSGTYAGRKIWENIWLPKAHQQIKLEDGQCKACNMGGARIKAIIGAHRNTDTNYQINSLFDLNGMIFGIVVGLAKEPNSKGYWNNTVARIITPDMPDYMAVMKGAEIITDGPTEGVAVQARPNNGGFNAPWPEEEGTSFPSEASGMQDVPF